MEPYKDISRNILYRKDFFATLPPREFVIDEDWIQADPRHSPTEDDGWGDVSPVLVENK